MDSLREQMDTITIDTLSQLTITVIVAIFAANRKPQYLISYWFTGCLSDMSVTEKGNMHYVYVHNDMIEM